MKRKQRGFTLIGLMIILGIIALLMALLVPAIQRVREAASRSQCQNNLRQIALAAINCADTYKGNLPPTVGPFPNQSRSFGPVFFHILPFLEQSNLYQRSQGYVWRNGTSAAVIRTYLCPSDPGIADNTYKGWLATSNYAANYLVFGKEGARFPASFTDGTSNTIMCTERFQMCHGDPCAWGYYGYHYWTPMFMYYSRGKFQSMPRQEECDAALPQSLHAGGIVTCMADGSARVTQDGISPQTWYHACTPSGGEVLGADF